MEIRSLDEFGYPGFSVTSDGVVFKNGAVQKQYSTKRGYMRVNNYKGKSARTHRLVAMAFVENPGGCNEVNHIDGDKLNNSASNLEWCTRKQNMSHAFSTGLCKVRYGENSPNAKLKDADLVEIRKMYVPRSKEFNYAAIGRMYGVDQSRIHQIVKGF